METPVQVFGVFEKPLNPMALAIALDVTFVARVFCGDAEKTKEIMKQAIRHKGFALVDIFQPCVSFNKINTYKWFKEHTYNLPDDYNPADRAGAFAKAIEEDPFPLGILYRSDHRKTFEENLAVYQNGAVPLFERQLDVKRFESLVRSKI
jgi:2-oxoglutarate/2-oxoacid ferredoxin oxidoreductase subunit beta